MKKSQLTQIIKEEVSKAIQESANLSKTSKLKLAIKEEIRRALNELSPELLNRAGVMAAASGRDVQADKFYAAAKAQEYQAAALVRNAKLSKVNPFVRKDINLYYDVTDDDGRGNRVNYKAITVPYEIESINIDTNDIYQIDFKRFTSDRVKLPMLPDRTTIHYNVEHDSYQPGFNLLGNKNSIGTPNKAYALAGFDQAGAQLLVKIAKAINPDSQLTPNRLIGSEQTPIAGKTFKSAEFPKYVGREI